MSETERGGRNPTVEGRVGSIKVMSRTFADNRISFETQFILKSSNEDLRLLRASASLGIRNGDFVVVTYAKENGQIIDLCVIDENTRELLFYYLAVTYN